MKILVINPVGHNTWDEQDRRLYESFATKETQITVASLPKGPASVETPEAYAEVIPLVINLARGRHEGYDAIVVNCFLDPGVDLLKGMLKKPVVGPCESSLALASVIGRRPVIVTVGNSALWMIKGRVKQLGYESKIVAVKGIPIGVLEIDKDREMVKKYLIERITEAVKNENADVAILGCTGLSGLASDVQEKTGVPVIDPAGAALKIAEATVKLGLTNALFRGD